MCHKTKVTLPSLVISIYRYIVDTDMIDVSIQSSQSMTVLVKCLMQYKTTVKGNTIIVVLIVTNQMS